MAITTIGTNSITDANITSAKVADDAITAAKLSDTFGMVLLNTTTVSSAVANVSFSSSLITDTYMDYRVVLRFVAGATNGQALFVFPSDDNGSTYDILIEQAMQYHDTKTSAAGIAGTNGIDGAVGPAGPIKFK